MSILGGGLGITIAMCSIIRWFFMFYDPSQMLLGSSIGLIVCLFSYIYNWMKYQEDMNEEIDKRLDAFTEWWIRQELE